jgi:hypothetical protein
VDQGFHNFNAKRIEDLLPRKPGRRFAGAQYALRPATRAPQRKRLAWFGIGCALLATGGVAAWRQHLIQLEEEERARAMEEARRQRQTAAAAIPHPWRSQPLPAVLAAACQPAPDLMVAGGWALAEFQCTAQQISYQWTRGDSSVAFLRAQLPPAQIELGGGSARHTQALMLAAGGDEPLVPAQPLLSDLTGRIQLLGLQPKIALLPNPVPPAALPGAEAPPMPSWRTYSWSVQAGTLPPMALAAVLTEPGIRLEKLSYRAGEWFIEGVIYAN